MNTRDKWNTKYKERINLRIKPAPNPRLKNLSAYLSGGGTVLDLACGLGGNSFFLAQMDYQVEAMDISDVAVTYIQEQATKNNLSIQPQIGDLTELNTLNWKNSPYNLIVISYYLDRSLFPIINSMIKEDGYLFIETFYQSQHNENQGVSNHYKLRPKELLTEFSDWEVLYFEENEQEGWQSIFCQKR
ncbi:MAG: methyltransferase domain-containing protein [Bacillus sp. (in: Bacteria)]|nr:methyltransferase domain-containing protein [Bacillus sp. (in: firmicutes)]